MRLFRLVPAAVVAAVFLAAGAAGAPPAAPTGLHGFLLRADEAAHAGDSFPRTPAFAWDPVPGASGYEFQLSTSPTFNDGDSRADNGVFYDTNSLTSPVAAPGLVLPWISGAPHALYARVRATTASGITAWSTDYGFDLSPSPAYPTPLTTQGDPGVLRWTAVPGADAYQIWLVDLPSGGKIVKTRTNVLDEREFYSFHGSQQWIGSVRWRVRAVRSIEGGTPANRFPVATYGKWSPIYKSTNPTLATGALKLNHTLSDVVETGTGAHTEPAHKLMPAFTWSGDTVTLPNGTPVTAELFRVEIFSDSQCLNMVYAGPVVGGQSWAPRAFGGSIQLPSTNTLGAARTAWPSDGGQGSTQTYDGTAISSVEDLSPAAPTSAAPPDAIPAGASQAVTASADGATIGGIAGSQSVGAPVDLWDTAWPDTGYYWTVMPVAPALAASNGTVASPGASKGSTIVPVNDTSRFVANEIVTIGVAPNTDTAIVSSVGNGLLTLNAPLNAGHLPGDPIVVLGGAGGYQDVMLPEDLCGQANMRHQLGIESEPTVASPEAPFVSGLSTDGKLVSADEDTSFYGRPLVAWAPALRAEKYEVEWSETDKPFVAVGNLLTTSTAAILPLGTGQWYYRIRGFSYNLPTGAQQMSWSDVQSLVIGSPSFKIDTSSKGTYTIVGGSKTTKQTGPKTKTKTSAKSSTSALTKAVQGIGFNLKVPKSWSATKATNGAPAVGTADGSTNVTTLKEPDKDYRSEAVTFAAAARKAGGTVTTKAITLPIGSAKVVTAKSVPSYGTTVTAVVYLFGKGKTTYVVAFETPPSKYAANAALFGKIAATARLG
jgi:hypothetical protein